MVKNGYPTTCKRVAYLRVRRSTKTSGRTKQRYPALRQPPRARKGTFRRRDFLRAKAMAGPPDRAGTRRDLEKPAVEVLS